MQSSTTVKLAAGDGGKATSRQGALQSLAQHGFGRVLLALLALGFAAYAVWRFVQAFAEHDDDENEAKGKAKMWVWGAKSGHGRFAGRSRVGA